MIHLAVVTLYIGALLFWFRTLYRRQNARTGGSAAWITAAAVAVHLVAVADFMARYDQLPLVGLGPALSTLALIMGLFLMSLFALGEVARVGIALLPLIVAVEAAALVLGIHPSGAVPDFQGFWFAAHVTLAFAGYGGAALAAAAAVLYLIQFRSLKGKRLGAAFRFIPPLAVLDRLGLLSQAVGLVNLTLALVVGWAWTLQFLGTAGADDPKVLWAAFTWLLMIVPLAARARGARREWRGALASIASFSTIVLSYLLLRVGADGGGLFP